eukprot:3219013-Amphidinium_carterae.1
MPALLRSPWVEKNMARHNETYMHSSLLAKAILACTAAQTDVPAANALENYTGAGHRLQAFVVPNPEEESKRIAQHELGLEILKIGKIRTELNA